MARRYTVLTTFPADGCANVGDQLIEVSLKSLVERELGAVEFATFFREDPLEEHLDEVNATRAILLPGFAIRDTPVYPACYRLAQNLEELRVPLVPVGANWNAYPGDEQTRAGIRFSEPTRNFLVSISRQVAHFTCREFTLCDVLARHGVHNTSMTGDPAWYDPATLGQPMRRPREVRGLLFSPPMSPYFVQQARDVLQMLAEEFPKSRKICAMHCADMLENGGAGKLKPRNDASLSAPVTEKNSRIRQAAAEAGFEVRDVFGDVSRLNFYKELDLHVGYECHAHVSFFRWRIPSVLIAEDARGYGFNHTFRIGGFTGFRRCQDDLPRSSPEGGTSGYCVSVEEFSVAPADQGLVARVRQFLRDEQSWQFLRYAGVAGLIDETYQRSMAPFLRSLP